MIFWFRRRLSVAAKSFNFDANPLPVEHPLGGMPRQFFSWEGTATGTTEIWKLPVHPWLEVKRSHLKGTGLGAFVAQVLGADEVAGLRVGGMKGDPECEMNRQGKSVKCCS